MRTISQHITQHNLRRSRSIHLSAHIQSFLSSNPMSNHTKREPNLRAHLRPARPCSSRSLNRRSSGAVHSLEGLRSWKPVMILILTPTRWSSAPVHLRCSYRRLGLWRDSLEAHQCSSQREPL